MTSRVREVCATNPNINCLIGSNMADPCLHYTPLGGAIAAVKRIAWERYAARRSSPRPGRDNPHKLASLILLWVCLCIYNQSDLPHVIISKYSQYSDLVTTSDNISHRLVLHKHTMFNIYILNKAFATQQTSVVSSISCKSVFWIFKIKRTSDSCTAILLFCIHIYIVWI